MTDPINNILWIQASLIHANHWNPNRVHLPELKLLEHSLLTNGWIHPIVINKNHMLIDGFHRWRLAQDNLVMRERYKLMVPAVVLDIEDDEAMAMSVRINRAKGTHVAIEMHKLVECLFHQHLWRKERIGNEIGATPEEIDLLLQENVFTNKNIKDWAYSRAWYPSESGIKQGGGYSQMFVF